MKRRSSGKINSKKERRRDTSLSQMELNLPTLSTSTGCRNQRQLKKKKARNQRFKKRLKAKMIRRRSRF